MSRLLTVLRLDSGPGDPNEPPLGFRVAATALERTGSEHEACQDSLAAGPYGGWPGGKRPGMDFFADS